MSDPRAGDNVITDVAWIAPRTLHRNLGRARAHERRPGHRDSKCFRLAHSRIPRREQKLQALLALGVGEILGSSTGGCVRSTSSPRTGRASDGWRACGGGPADLPRSVPLRLPDFYYLEPSVPLVAAIDCASDAYPACTHVSRATKPQRFFITCSVDPQDRGRLPYAPVSGSEKTLESRSWTSARVTHPRRGLWRRHGRPELERPTAATRVKLDVTRSARQLLLVSPGCAGGASGSIGLTTTIL